MGKINVQCFGSKLGQSLHTHIESFYALSKEPVWSNRVVITPK